MSGAEKPGWNPRFDGLRGIAILLVLLQHYIGNYLAPGGGGALDALARLAHHGWTGVDVFFVLSGFLICGILLDHRESPTLLRTFYIRRACRILPLYYLVVLSFYGVRWFTAGGPAEWLGYRPPPVLPQLFFLQNVAMVRADNWFSPYLGMTWSLAVEEQFYLTLPLLVLVLPRAALAVVLAAVVGAAPVLRALFPGLQAFLLPPWRADGLAAGALLAIAFRSPTALAWLTLRRRELVWTAGVLALVWWIIVGPTRGPLEASAAVALSAALVALAGLDVQGRIGKVLAWRPLAALGRISYAFYLFHFPVFMLIFALAGRRGSVIGLSNVVLLVAALMVSVSLSVLSYELFETPWIRWGHRWQYRRRPPATTETPPTAAG